MFLRYFKEFGLGGEGGGVILHPPLAGIGFKYKPKFYGVSFSNCNLFSTTNLILQLNGPLRKSEVCFVWKIKIRTLLVKSMKVSVPVQQITSVKQKEMLKHGGMNTRIQIKILNQLNTSESSLIINSIEKYFSQHLQTRNYVRSWNHQ